MTKFIYPDLFYKNITKFKGVYASVWIYSACLMAAISISLVANLVDISAKVQLILLASIIPVTTRLIVICLVYCDGYSLFPEKPMYSIRSRIEVAEEDGSARYNNLFYTGDHRCVWTTFSHFLLSAMLFSIAAICFLQPIAGITTLCILFVAAFIHYKHSKNREVMQIQQDIHNNK